MHTSFALSAEGDYLALVQPDGATKATELTPSYPPQSEDVSFGVGASTTTLIARTTPLTYKIPTGPADDATWFTPGFLDASLWNSGTTYPAPTVRITEVGTGSSDRIEVQNVSGQAVNTTGWKLILNGSQTSGINTVLTFSIHRPRAWRRARFPPMRKMSAASAAFPGPTVARAGRCCSMARGPSPTSWSGAIPRPNTPP